MSESDFERDLRTALAIEPSGEFCARVRVGVASEPVLRRWRRAWLVAPAGIAAAVLLVITAQRPGTTTRPATRPLDARSLILPVQSEIVAAAHRLNHTLEVRGQEFRTPRHVRSVQRSEPEVLISGDEARGIRLLMAAVAEGRLDPASLPPDPGGITDIVIAPITIPSIDVFGDSKGARQ